MPEDRPLERTVNWAPRGFGGWQGCPLSQQGWGLLPLKDIAGLAATSQRESSISQQAGH